MKQSANQESNKENQSNNQEQPKRHWSDAARKGNEEDVLKPDTDKKGIEKPKKRHFWRNFLIVILIIVLGLVVAVAATGLYDIPVLSSALGANKPKDLGIKVSDEAIVSLDEKLPVDYGGDLFQFTLRGERNFEGEVAVDFEATSEEFTSLINKVPQNNRLITDVQVNFVEGGIEMSGMLKQYVKAPVYLKLDVTKTGEKSVAINIQKAKVGVFSIPEKYIQKANESIQNLVNDRMQEVPGFSMETLEYHGGRAVFKGTYPEKVTPGEGEWF